jgi:hypothetical protein
MDSMTGGMPDPRAMAVASTRVYVVYDQRTGAIAHVHETVTFEGGKGRTVAEELARAVDMAERFGHRVEGLRALQVDSFDSRKALRVDPRTMQLVPIGARRTAGTKRGPATGRAARPGSSAPAKRLPATARRRPQR